VGGTTFGGERGASARGVRKERMMEAHWFTRMKRPPVCESQRADTKIKIKNSEVAEALRGAGRYSKETPFVRKKELLEDVDGKGHDVGCPW